MDLNTIKPNERTMEILHPGDKSLLGIRVSILSVSDDRMKKIKRQMADERYRMEQKGKAFKHEIYESNLTELAFAAITAWEWYNPTGLEGDKDFDASKQALFNKEIPPFNKKFAVEIFEALPWFREQIITEIGDTEAFFAPSRQS